MLVVVGAGVEAEVVRPEVDLVHGQDRALDLVHVQFHDLVHVADHRHFVKSVLFSVIQRMKVFH